MFRSLILLLGLLVANNAYANQAYVPSEETLEFLSSNPRATKGLPFPPVLKQEPKVKVALEAKEVIEPKLEPKPIIVAKPQPKPESEPIIVAKPQPKPESEPIIVAKPQPKLEPKPIMVAKPQPKLEPKIEPKPAKVAKPQPDTLVVFGANSAELSENNKLQLSNLAKTFKNTFKHKIMIYTYNLEEAGSSFMRRRLSFNRSTAIRSFLLSLGYKNIGIKIINTTNAKMKNVVEVKEITN